MVDLWILRQAAEITSNLVAGLNGVGVRGGVVGGVGWMMGWFGLLQKTNKNTLIYSN